MAYFFALLKNMIYGTTVFFTRSLTESVGVMDILALRFMMSFIALWLLKKTKILNIGINCTDIFKGKNAPCGFKYIFLAALFEPVLYMFFETMGISMTTEITSAVIFSLSPISSAVLSSVILKEKPTLLKSFFLLIGIVGVIYIAINTKDSDGTNAAHGIFYLVLAVVSGSLFSIFSRKSSKNFNAFEVTYMSCFLGMLVFNAVNVVRHLYFGTIHLYFEPYFNFDNLIGFVYLSIISTVVATSMSNYALGKISVPSMAAFGGISTLTTVVIGVLFKNEMLYPFHYIGFLLILIRMIAVSYIDIKKNKQISK